MTLSAVPLPALIVLLVVYLPQAVALSVIDVREHRLPNRHVLVLSGSIVLVTAGVALLYPPARGDVVLALATGLLGGALAVCIALLSPSLLGMGDAKTIPAVLVTTCLLGWDVLLAGLLGTAILGGACGIVTLLRTRDARAAFAYGPVLLAMPVVGIALAPWMRSGLGL